MIYESLFPLEIDMNSMDENKLKIYIQDLFLNSSSVPWGSKFHLSYTIGDVYYSFN